jgi:hypothetical protein
VSGDPETEAIETIATALESLDRAACARVLEWAKTRYTQMHILDGDLDAFTRFVEGLTEAARTIGDVTPIEIVRFAENVQRYERERVKDGAKS